MIKRYMFVVLVIATVCVAAISEMEYAGYEASVNRCDGGLGGLCSYAIEPTDGSDYFTSFTGMVVFDDFTGEQNVAGYGCNGIADLCLSTLIDTNIFDGSEWIQVAVSVYPTATGNIYASINEETWWLSSSPSPFQCSQRVPGFTILSQSIGQTTCLLESNHPLLLSSDLQIPNGTSLTTSVSINNNDTFTITLSEGVDGNVASFLRASVPVWVNATGKIDALAQVVVGSGGGGRAFFDNDTHLRLYLAANTTRGGAYGADWKAGGEVPGVGETSNLLISSVSYSQHSQEIEANAQ